VAFEVVCGGAFACALVYAAVSDTLTFEVPNFVSVGLVAVFAATAPFYLTLGLIGWHAAVGLAVLAVGFGLFAFGILGGADAKVLAAAALWFGWPAVYDFVVLVALFGGALTLILTVFRRIRLSPRLLARRWLARLHDTTEGLPYCLAIGPAGLISMTQLPLFGT
jgi:prepilin peptidase CpaA